MDIVHKKECFVASGKAFDTRIEAENYLMEQTELNQSGAIHQYFIDHTDYHTRGEIRDVLNKYGFYYLHPA